MALTCAPGRQQTSLRGGSGWHIGPSVPLSWESPTTVTRLFLLVELVVIREGGPSDLCASSDVDGSTPAPSTTLSSTSRASYLLCRGTCGDVVGKGRVRLLPQLWTRFHSLFSFASLPSARWGEVTSALWCRPFFTGYSWVDSWVVRARLHQSISFSVSLMLCSLSTSSLSSATRQSR